MINKLIKKIIIYNKCNNLKIISTKTAEINIDNNIKKQKVSKNLSQIESEFIKHELE